MGEPGMAILVTLLVGISSKLAADEIKAWLPWITKRVTSSALSKLPSDKRERYEEEWQSDLDQIPSEFSKLIYALGLIRAAKTMARMADKSKYIKFIDIAKRALDIVSALMAITTLLPLAAVIILLVSLSSSGPIFRKRGCIGLSGSLVHLLTFRTRSAIFPYSVTRVGRLLRKLSIDQLPLFINLLRGEVALVGPRPIDCAQAAQLAKAIPGHLDRVSVKPGLTGLAQIHEFPHGFCPHEELILDREYISNRCLKLDLEIIMKTVVYVLRGV